jgi:hypothetical protein
MLSPDWPFQEFGWNFIARLSCRVKYRPIRLTIYNHDDRILPWIATVGHFPIDGFLCALTKHYVIFCGRYVSVGILEAKWQNFPN